MDRIDSKPARRTRPQVVVATMAAFGALATAPAFADVTVRLERLGDQDARLTVSGSLGVPGLEGNLNLLLLGDPFAVPPAPGFNDSVLAGGDLHAGSYAFNFAYDWGGDPNNVIPYYRTALYFGQFSVPPDYIEPVIPAGQTFSGALRLHLPAGVSLALPGTTGTVFWGNARAGDWQVTAVPEPGVGLLLAVGTVVAGLRLRRRRKTTSPTLHDRA